MTKHDAFDAFRARLEKKKPRQHEEDGGTPEQGAQQGAGDAADPADPLARVRAARERVRRAEQVRARQTDEADGEPPPAGDALARIRAARARLASTRQGGGSAAGEGPPAGAPPASSGSRQTGDPIARFRAARQRLEAQRGSPPPEEQPTAGRRPPRTTGRGKLRTSHRVTGQHGDEFDAYLRAREEEQLAEAKRRAFAEGVEVEPLNPERIARHHSERLSAEELGVERSELVDRLVTLRLDAEELADELAELRPDGYTSHRARRLSIEELEEAAGALERPAGYETHRARRRSAEEVLPEISRPGEEGSAVVSHRHRGERLEADEREASPETVKGYRKYDF
jgi:hypothetical protein